VSIFDIQQHFNASHQHLTSSRDGIDRLLITCICVAVEVATGALYAPNGLQEVYEGILRMNPDEQPANPVPTKSRGLSAAMTLATDGADWRGPGPQCSPTSEPRQS